MHPRHGTAVLWVRCRVDDSRDRERPEVPAFSDLVLRSPPNWTAVCFLGMLGTAHLAVSIPSMAVGRWQSHLSLLLGVVFVAVAIAGYRFRSEVALMPSQRRVRLRTGIGRFRYERFIPFSGVRAVRLTVEPGLRATTTESLIELLCTGEDVPCPPTSIPRQQALFMAMAMNVPLIKVSEEDTPTPRQTAPAEDLTALRRP